MTARQNALNEMAQRAASAGAMLLWELTLIMKFSGLTEIC